MTQRRRLLSLLLALCTVGCAMAASKTIEAISLQPSPTCRIEIAPSRELLVRKLDESRVQITWRSPSAVDPSTEARLGCSNEAFQDQLGEAGFENQNGRWVYSGGSGSKDVAELNRPTWTGKGATYFAAGVCRAVVGQAVGARSTFSIDLCVGEADYTAHQPQLELLEKQVSVFARP